MTHNNLGNGQLFQIQINFSRHTGNRVGIGEENVVIPAPYNGVSHSGSFPPRRFYVGIE
jgi:hypothetical protein